MERGESAGLKVENSLAPDDDDDDDCCRSVVATALGSPRELGFSSFFLKMDYRINKLLFNDGTYDD